MKSSRSSPTRRRTLKLRELPAGAQVFVDATIFICHFTGLSRECRDLLERCERGEVAGVTSTAVLAEVSHRLMMIEAVSRGLVEPGNVAAKLRAKPAVVRKLDRYQEQVDLIPMMGVEILPVDLPTFHRSRDFRSRHGLLTNDSLVLAGAGEAGLDAVATADRDFRRVKEIRVYEPGDLR